MSNFSCTGYTSFIENGKIDNAKDFLKLCLRNFGVMMKYRDHPMGIIENPKFDGDDWGNAPYAQEQIKENRAELEKLKSIDLEEYRNEQVAIHTKELNRYEEYVKDALEFEARLDGILEGVTSWDSPDEFANIKDFAVSQIETTKEHLYINSYKEDIEKEKHILQVLKGETSESWEDWVRNEIAENIRYCERMVKSYTEDLERYKKADNRQEFYDRFIESISKIN